MTICAIDSEHAAGICEPANSTNYKLNGGMDSAVLGDVVSAEEGCLLHVLGVSIVATEIRI